MKRLSDYLAMSGAGQEISKSYREVAQQPKRMIGDEQLKRGEPELFEVTILLKASDDQLMFDPDTQTIVYQKRVLAYGTDDAIRKAGVSVRHAS